MKELYVIFQEDNGKVCLQDVNIIKESDKLYIINSEGISRKMVFKTQLYTFICKYMFGFDRKNLVDIWNQHQQIKLNSLKRQLEQFI